MKLGLMQPYFFPYIGYFDLIYQTDWWVVFDTVQYIRQGWVNRNRILHPSNGWQYITVPVGRHGDQNPIKHMQIAEDGRWRARMLGQVQHYKRKAPYFDGVKDMLSGCLQDTSGLLSQLNVRSLEKVCTYLDIPFRFALYSDMALKLGPLEEPGDWALRIAEALGASEYLNPPGGAHLYDHAKFEAAGIKLTIQVPVDFVYDCEGYEFQPNLSIIDVLMWNPPEAVRDYLASRSRAARGKEEVCTNEHSRQESSDSCY